MERKKSRKSLSPYSQRSRGDPKDLSPERSTKKKEKDHEEKVEEKKKEKKIKEKKKKKDNDEKEKKKKKKKDKKSNQKEAAKDDLMIKMTETDDLLIENKTNNDTSSSPLNKTDSVKVCNEEDNIQNRIECISQVAIAPIKEEFEDKSLAMNPEPPEFNELSPDRLDRAEFGTNPPNPNFKPIPELKSDMKPIDSLYGGLDDTEINTVITEKYSLLSEHSQTETKEAIIMLTTDKSPKKDEFLAPIPELSKWERDDTIEKPDDNDDDDNASGSPTEKIQREDEPKSIKMVTSEVLKRAENAIFQKAINAIRPIEIKKISESRKILYQNPEPKVLETVESANRESRKSVNVTINVGRNERNVEITEPAKKAKLDRTKFKPVPETAYSPTRLSAKERLGEKIEDSKERKVSPIKGFLERRDAKNENQSRSRSPRKEKRISPLLERRIESSSLGLTTTSGERKVFLEERKRDNKDRGDRSKERSDFRSDRHSSSELKSERENRIDCRTDFRSNRNDIKGERVDKDRNKERDREHRGRTPPSACAFKRTEMSKIGLLKSKDDEEEKKRDKKSREEKKRKKEHRSRSKSKEHKKRKEKKHKKDKDKNQEKKQKHKENVILKDKSDANETKISYENIEPPLAESLKKQRKNPRLVSDRKRSILDEANFEPDYSASDSESDGEEGKPSPAKKLKLDETEVDKEIEIKSLKKRSKSSSSEDTSSSSDTTSSDSDSSDESHKKKRKKHKKHKKKKSAKKDSSSDSDTFSDSSDSSSDEEKHKKKSKKSKSRSSKQSKKKKKSKHK